MDQHRGEILEEIVRKSGYSLKVLAERLKISRNTLYNKFKTYDLSYDFIIRVGEIIHYDFAYEYPEIKTKIGNIDNTQPTAELWRMEKKYTQLLERYNKLLGFLLRIANDYHLESTEKEIHKLLEMSS